MTATMRVMVSTPAEPIELGEVRHLRLEAPDGARGVLPGHEPARVSLLPGPMVFVDAQGEERYLATEGGIAVIDRDHVLLVCRWAAFAPDLDELRRQVARRRATRREAEHEARALAHRHEVATRRALAGLRRELPR